jgi:spore germination cell wall hydrolase CwlJ-like protein
MKESFRPKRDREDPVKRGGSAFIKGLQIGAVAATLGAGAMKMSGGSHESRETVKEEILHREESELTRMMKEMHQTPVQGYDARYFTKEELTCLTDNLYHEARGEPIQGRYAVIFATLERVLNKKFPKSICGVVHQPWQFSWTKDQKILAAPINPKEYLQMSLEVYELALGKTLSEASVEAGLRSGLPHGSIYYKDAKFIGSQKVQDFFSKLVRVGQIGTHEFFVVPTHAIAKQEKQVAHKDEKTHVPFPRPRPRNA